MTARMSHAVFSYGTLQYDSVQQSIFGRTIEGHPDAITGYREQNVVIADPAVIEASGTATHPMLIPDDDAVEGVAGTVYDLTDDELAAADAYEVDAYDRIEVPLASGRTAWVYVLRG